MSIDLSTKEIRGLNLRWLLSLIVVVATGTAGYFGVVSEIRTQNSINQAKFDMLQYQVQGLKDMDIDQKMSDKDQDQKIEAIEREIQDGKKKK